MPRLHLLGFVLASALALSCADLIGPAPPEDGAGAAGAGQPTGGASSTTTSVGGQGGQGAEGGSGGKGPATITALTVGESSACVIKSNELLCWGSNSYGQLGRNDPHDPKNPTPSPAAALVPGVPDLADVGRRHACAAVGNDVYCWGHNQTGQVDGTKGPDVLAPQLVPLGVTGDIQRLSLGDDHSCIQILVASEVEVWCWGYNFGGRAGQPPSLSIPPTRVHADVLTASPIRNVAAGSEETCIEFDDGVLSCFGDKETIHGKQGTACADWHGLISFPASHQGVTVGRDHACLHTSDTSFECWGSKPIGDGCVAFCSGDPKGCIANSGTIATGIEQLHAGETFTCRVQTATPLEVQCFVHAFGAPAFPPDTFTTSELELDNLDLVAAGGEVACASDGYRVKCWGAPGSAQLLDGNGPVPFEIDLGD